MSFIGQKVPEGLHRITKVLATIVACLILLLAVVEFGDHIRDQQDPLGNVGLMLALPAVGWIVTRYALLLCFKTVAWIWDGFRQAQRASR